MNLSRYYKFHFFDSFFPEYSLFFHPTDPSMTLKNIPKKTQNLEFCQSQRSRFDPLEAAPIQMDRRR